MNVIGITGLAGSGKSTVADYLVEAHGYTRLSFAGPLKKMLRTLNPVIGRYGPGDVRLDHLLGMGMTEQDIKDGPYGKEYRRLLQVLGTDCIRAVDPDFWVKAATAQMTDDNGLYVIDDVRFPNEANVIKDLNKWGLWNIKREGQELADDAHVSEQNAGNMGEWQTLFNDHTKEFLYSEVDRALKLAFSDTALLADAA